MNIFELTKNLLKDGEIERAIEMLYVLNLDAQTKSDCTILSSQYNTLRSESSKGLIASEEHARQMNRIIHNINNIIEIFSTKEEPILKTDLFDLYDDIKWVEFNDSLDSSTTKLSNYYNQSNTDLDKEKCLRYVSNLYFRILDKYGQGTSSKFILNFDQKNEQRSLINSSGFDIYKIVIDLFLSGIPEVPHFYGLTSFKSSDLFDQKDILVFLVSLLHINKKGYTSNVIDVLTSLGLKISESNFYPLYYLLGQCYRKSNRLVEALSYFNRGILLVESIPNPSLHDLLVLSELYRGIATVNRKKSQTNVSSNDYEKIERYFRKSQTVLDQISSTFTNLTRSDLQSYNKVASDIWFSYGYFNFEYFFNQESNFTTIDTASANAIIEKFQNSLTLNPSFSAPLSRIALLRLYLSDTYESIVNFHSVYDSDNQYLEKKNDQERKFTLIWVSLAILLISTNFEIKFQEIIAFDQVKKYIDRSFEAGASIGIAECHLNDLKILLKIFSHVHKISMAEEPSIVEILKKYNDYYMSIKH
jgi:tetratricopeptide (TPR) repeat protein